MIRSVEQPSAAFREALREARDFKVGAKELNVYGGGSRGIDGDMLLGRVSAIEHTLREDNHDWIVSKKEGLSEYLSGIPNADQQLEESYRAGLDSYFIQRLRLFKKLDKKIDANYFEDKDIETGIRTYTFDFLSILNTCVRNDVPPRTALEIAENTRWVDPKTLSSMIKEYADLTPSLVLAIFVRSPKQAAESLQLARSRLEELSVKYPAAERSLIIRAIGSHPKDPEGFVVESLSRIEKLIEQYPMLNQSTVYKTVINNSANPELRLSEIRDMLEELRSEFPTLPPSIILSILETATDGARERVLSTVDLVDKLINANPDIRKSDIHDAILNSTSDPQEYINNTESERNALKNKFPSISMNLIRRAMRYTNPEDVLKEAIDAFPSFQERYPGIPRSYLLQVLVQNNENQEVAVESFWNEYLRLKKLYPQLMPSTILKSVLGEGKSLEKNLQQIIQAVNDLSGEFPYISRAVLERVYTNFPTRSRLHVVESLARIPDFQRLYPDANINSLRNALLLSPNDPGRYVEHDKKWGNSTSSK